jgi:hypothetical protein
MHYRIFLAASAASVSLACGIASPVMAQETTSTIRGTVTNGGAPVAGATVEILNTATGAKTTVVTGASGGFNATGLRSGDSYTVTVTAPGVGSTQITDVVTVLTQVFELPIELDAASAGTEIVVSATRIRGAGSVSQGPATVLNAETIANVVSTSRDIRDLSRRDPFARLDDTPGGGRAISFAGQNPRYNRFTVDGVGISDSFGLNPDGLPSRRSPIPLDAIGQFQAKVAPFDIRDGNFQGGAINIVLRSGTNEFQGTGFYAYSSDELNGKETKAGPGVPTGVVNLPNFTVKNFGAQISGPIIKDTLFFMVAAERLRAPRPLAEGPGDNNAGTAIPTLTQAQVDLVSQIAQSVYNYDTGGVAKSNQDADDRLVARLDWNISSTQRAALTYMYAKDSIIINSANSFTTPPFGLSLASNTYIQGNRLHTGVFQLNSDWSDSFSTEVRGFYKNYVRIQDPVVPRNFAEMQVCTAPTSDRTLPGAASSANINCPTTHSTISFGPDISRHTNALRVENWGGLIQGRLRLGDHDVKAFFEFQDVKSFNSFVQRSLGQYYFDSIADFQARTAQRYRYQTNPITLNADDSAAKFRYQSFVLGIQDSWRINDQLNVDIGLRYDFYAGSDRPVRNPVFATRYGFDNTKYVNGLGVLQPRFGFTYRPTRELSFRGGVGVFAGGTPDVYVANSFSNTGVLTNLIDVQQLNNQSFSGSNVTQEQGAAILTNVTGSIPGAANAVLGAVAVSPTAPTNSLAQNFKLPRQLRATLSADWEPETLGGLGSGWSFGADVLYSRVLQQVFFTDLRVVPNGTFTPDGRARYTPLTSFGDTNADIQLTNSTEGRGIFFVLRARKNFDFGLDMGVSYTHANIKDRNPATSSTATSNYGAGVSLDGNGPVYGTSNDQVDNAIKFDFTFSRAFFGDNKTTISLFGETRTGKPYSFTMRDPAGRSTVFGVVNPGTGTQSRYLLYVPTGVNDPKVSFDNANNAALFDDFINRSGLAKYRGQIAPRNAFRSAWVTKIDLSVSQEIPVIGRAKLKLFADIENFTNLINKNWGQVREYAFPHAIAPVQVSCLTAPVPTGTAPGANTAANAAAPCAQYRYTPNATTVVNGVTQFAEPTDTIYPQQSLYTIRVGVRFSF